MGARSSTAGSDLFIVDNTDRDWQVLRYLREWCDISRATDVATGYFEIGALLALDGQWQKVDQIRVLMGDEVSLRTERAFAAALGDVGERLDHSIEAEKERNDFLTGVPAIIEAIRSGKIACRVYRKAKFHAKAYITHARLEVVGASALVGSSNLTYPALTENIELNIQITGRQVTALQEWHERYWSEAEDVSAEILRVIERHTRDYSPFQIYAKSLHEFCKGHALTGDQWDEADPAAGGSHMFSVLDKYQQDGYRSLMKIARQHGGAFLCDGVGLGKTFVGLMLIERLVHDGRNVLLLAPKATREAVWNNDIARYLPHLEGAFTNLKVLNHTDLQRGGDYVQTVASAKQRADVIIIDEAHHFRNPGTLGDLPQTAALALRKGRIRGAGRAKPSRYRVLYDLIEGPGNRTKQVFMLTATPVNNKLDDLRHMLELFTRQQDDRFRSSVGINSVRGHFRRLERDVRRAMAAREEQDGGIETNLTEAGEVLGRDPLFQALVVQRSRAYVKQSQLKAGAAVTMFPQREPPRVAEYSVKRTYGRLLGMVDRAFAREKPLFALAIYYPLAYYKGSDTSIDPFLENRQQQVVGLIRTQFLKRFESSVAAFGLSCERLLLKLLTFAEVHSEPGAERERLGRWKARHSELLDYVRSHREELDIDPTDDEATDDLVPEEMLEDTNPLPRDEYKVEEILSDTFQDLDQILEFLRELQKLRPSHDDKLKSLVNLLAADPVLRQYKVLIFSEFADTARYLKRELEAAGITGVEEVDSATKRDRSEALRRFAPYYNGSSSAGVGKHEIRVLISTDVLSEGLNLQDATRLINYDLHWNPVRLMQRIGRVDRRMNPEVEKRLLEDHPEQADLRGRVVYWNFLPPDDLNLLLRLYGTVAHKTLRISKTFGIEGRKLLRPEDDFDALREFNEEYEGTPSLLEQMHLEYQDLLAAYPGLAQELDSLPGKVFSGKEHPEPDTRAVFFCYALPAADTSGGEGEVRWTEEAGVARWYLHDLATESIVEDPAAMLDAVRSVPETPRRCAISQQTLSEARAKVDRHIKNTYLKQVQAPIGVKPALKAWMELS
jgi:superfamily II DNA or RNA helicase